MRRLIIFLFTFVFAFFVFSLNQVSAKVISNQNGSVTVAKGEVINDDLFVAAQSVEIAGVVNGDVFVAAQSLSVTGTVNGSLHAGGNLINLGGVIKGNVYVGGQSIVVNDSSIGGSILVGGATVSVDKNSTVGGSVLVGAGTFTLDSQVKRSVYAGSGSFTLGDNTRIGKDLYYGSSNDSGQVSISDKAVITGETFKSEIDTANGNAKVEMAREKFPAIFRGFRIVSTFVSLLGALIIGFICFKLFGKYFSQVSGIVTESFWKSLGVGFLVSIAFVPALIVLLITVIGIPVAGLSLLVFLLYIYLAKIVVGSAFGVWLVGKFNWKKLSTFTTFALGLAALYVIKMIPFVGGLASVVILWSGLGALILKFFSSKE
jgi:hypothetical protein